MQRSHLSLVSGGQVQLGIRCVAERESKATAFDLDNFLVTCRTVFSDMYERRKFYERRVLPCGNPTVAKHALESLVLRWCSEIEGSLEHPSVNGIVSSIMKESRGGVIVVGVFFIVGYIYESKSFYKLPLFKVYRSEWDEEPIIVDANAVVHKSLADCISEINLPDSFMCLPRDGALQFDHRLNNLPLEFYGKTRSYRNHNRFCLFAGVLGASVIAVASFRLWGPELSKVLHASKANIKKMSLLVLDFVKINLTVENFIIIVKYSLLFLIRYWSNDCIPSYVMDSVPSELCRLLSEKANVCIAKDNVHLILIFVVSILEAYHNLENFDEIKNFFSDNLNWDINYVRLMSFSSLGLTILCKVLNLNLKGLFERIDLGETTIANVNSALDTIRPYHKGLVHLHSVLSLGGKISISKIFRTTFHMFKNFVNQRATKKPSDKMMKIIELTGDDCSLSSFLSATGLQDGELREEGKKCLEGVDAGEDAEEFVQIYTDSEGKSLFAVEGPVEEAVRVARTRLRIPCSVPFERKEQNFGLFHGVPGKNVFLFNCVDDNVEFTFIYQKSVVNESEALVDM